MTTLQILLFCIYIGTSFARTDKDIKGMFIKLGLECNHEHPVSGDEFEMLKDHKIPKNDNAKCLLACVYKKLDWIDSKGMFDDAAAYKMSLAEYADDAAKIQNARKLYDLCKKVNDETVGDGEKGCDRATSLTTCLTENSGKMGFML